MSGRLERAFLSRRSWASKPVLLQRKSKILKGLIQRTQFTAYQCFSLEQPAARSVGLKENGKYRCSK